MKIKAEGHIAEIDKKVAIQTIERRAAKKIKQQVLQTYREALKVHPDADVYRLSETLYRNDVKAWKKLSKKENWTYSKIRSKWMLKSLLWTCGGTTCPGSLNNSLQSI